MLINDTFLPLGPPPHYIRRHLSEHTIPSPSFRLVHPSFLALVRVCSHPTCTWHMWAGDAQIPVFFLLHLPACWTPFLGDLLRHGWTHLDPSQAPPNVPKGSTPCSPPNRLHPHVPYSHPPSLQAMNPESFSGHSTQLPKCLSTPSHPLPLSHCPFSGLGTHS